MGGYCDWKFRIVLDSLKLAPEHTGAAARDDSDWKVVVSNDDQSAAVSIECKNVRLGSDGFLPLDASQLDASAPNFRQMLLKVNDLVWETRFWTAKGYSGPVQRKRMGWEGQNMTARTDAGSGPVGGTLGVKAVVRVAGLGTVTGYDTINVGPLVNNLARSGCEAHTVALPADTGGLAFTVLPLADHSHEVKKRRLARAGAEPTYQVHQMAAMKLPQCCVNVLTMIAWRMRVHYRLVEIAAAKGWAKKIKGWIDKASDPAWVRETSKRVLSEAYGVIRDKLKPPPNELDTSLEKETLMLSALLLAHDLESLTDHAMDHSGDLAELWEELHDAIVDWKDFLVEQAEKNIDKKLVRRVLQAN